MTSLVPSSSSNSNNEEDQLNRINLQALQNRDPYIRKILDQAQRVCVYKFLADKRQWERQELEGTLFVYERSCEPAHGFVILSTVSRETFVQIIKPSLEFKHSPNYEAFLQYKVDVGDIYGLWFISKNDCPRVTECLMSLTTKAKERQITNLSTNSGSSDIYSLLVNAQEKFQESKRQHETNPNDSINNPMPAALLRLFSTKESTTAPVDEREQELKKTLGILGKPALSVTELEKQLLPPSTSFDVLQKTTTTPDCNGIERHRLMTPADFQTPTLTKPNQILSREQLRQILVNMLQNDDEFLIELYNAFANNQRRLF